VKERSLHFTHILIDVHVLRGVVEDGVVGRPADHLLVDLILEAGDGRTVRGDDAAHKVAVLLADRARVVEGLVGLEHRVDGCRLLGLGGVLGGAQVHKLLTVAIPSFNCRKLEVGIDRCSLEVSAGVVPIVDTLDVFVGYVVLHVAGHRVIHRWADCGGKETLKLGVGPDVNLVAEGVP